MAFTRRDALRRKLRAIPVAARKALKSQNAANAAELVETIKGFAPVDSGTLRASIKHQDVSDSTRISQRVSEGGAEAPHARHVEHGTVDTPAQPHFWAGWRLKRRRFKARMSRAAKKAIAEAIK
jgi:hypothetical protein